MSGILLEWGWHFEFGAVTLNKIHWGRDLGTVGSWGSFDPQKFTSGSNVVF